MISLRARDLRGLTKDELAAAISSTRARKLFTLRFQSATGALEGSARLKIMRQEIARILTVQQEQSRAEA